MLTLYTVAFLNPCTARLELSTKSDLITITNMSDQTVNIVSPVCLCNWSVLIFYFKLLFHIFFFHNTHLYMA